jgi:hypothetical protein
MGSGLPAWTLTWNAPNFTQSDANGVRLYGVKLLFNYKWGTPPSQRGAADGGRLYFYRQADSCPAVTYGPFPLSATGMYATAGFASTPFPGLPAGSYKYCAEYDDTVHRPGTYSQNVTTAFTLNAFDLNTPQTNTNQTISSNGTSPSTCP